MHLCVLLPNVDGGGKRLCNFSLWLNFGGFRRQGSGWTHGPDFERCGRLQIMWRNLKSRDSQMSILGHEIGGSGKLTANNFPQ